jgi:hypothetical protein
MSYKKIKFIPASEYTSRVEPAPTNSASLLPDWYRKTPRFLNGEQGYNDFLKLHKDLYNNDSGADINLTLKNCQPFIDAFTSGYMLKLPAAIMVWKDPEGNPRIKWSTKVDVLDSQDNRVLGKFETPAGCHDQFFRWQNTWVVETPSGYSSLFTHPLNRFDLPFVTLSAVIDTDLHPNAVVVPFFIKKDFEGVIEEGTPIAQVIPFKRDNWDSSIEKTNNSGVFAEGIVKASFIQAYKKKFWTKKIYR